MTVELSSKFAQEWNRAPEQIDSDNKESKEHNVELDKNSADENISQRSNEDEKERRKMASTMWEMARENSLLNRSIERLERIVTKLKAEVHVLSNEKANFERENSLMASSHGKGSNNDESLVSSSTALRKVSRRIANARCSFRN